MAEPLSEEQGKEGKLEEALSAAQEAAQKVLDRFLGPSTGSYSILVSAEKEGGTTHLSIDIIVTRPRANPKLLEEVADAAIDSARRAFEKVYGVGGSPSRGSKRGRESSHSGSQER